MLLFLVRQLFLVLFSCLLRIWSQRDQGFGFASQASKVNSRGRKNKVSIARNSTASPKGHLPRLSRTSRWVAHRSSLLGKGSLDGTQLKLVTGGKGLGERKHHTGGNEPLMGQRGSAGGFADVTAMSASGSLPTSHVLLLCSQFAWDRKGQ